LGDKKVICVQPVIFLTPAGSLEEKGTQSNVE